MPTGCPREGLSELSDRGLPGDAGELSELSAGASVGQTGLSCALPILGFTGSSDPAASRGSGHAGVHRESRRGGMILWR